MSLQKILTKKSTFLIILLLFSIFIFPRILRLTSDEDYFGGDFGFYYLLTKSIVVDHKLPLIGHEVGDIGGFAQGVGWNYLLVIPFTITNGHPFGAKALMFIISILTFAGAFLFSYRLLGKQESLFIAIFISISPHLINWSDGVWSPYVIPLLTALYLGFILLFLIKKESKYFFISTLFFGLMIHFEIASFGLLLPSYIALITYFIYKNLLKVKNLLIGLCILVFIFLPHILYDFSNNFYNLKGLLNILSFEKSYNLFFNISQILANRQEMFKSFFSTILPLINFRFFIFFLLYILFGTCFYLKEENIKFWKKIFLIYIIISILSTVLFLIIFPALRIPFWWFTHLTIFCIFLSGITLSYYWNKQNALHKILITFFVIVFISSFYHDLFQMLEKEKKLKQIPYAIRIQEPIDYIYKDSQNKNFNIIYATGRSQIFDYKYMFWYIGKTKYKNSLGFKNLDLAFSSFGGKPIAIDETKQFRNLNPGIYYIIITTESIKNGYANKLLNKSLNDKIIDNKKVGDNFVVQKRLRVATN